MKGNSLTAAKTMVLDGHGISAQMVDHAEVEEDQDTVLPGPMSYSRHHPATGYSRGRGLLLSFSLFLLSCMPPTPNPINKHAPQEYFPAAPALTLAQAIRA
ncbi:MAG: hypothetical protein EOO56_25440, partial [Hymenobacter sp.]